MSMKKNKALLAEWSTPQDLFDKLDAEFGFTLDVCAQPFNAKCKKFFTPDDDGLSQDWGGETTFCCPPSGKKSFREWTAKARKESKKRKTTVVMLLPVSTRFRVIQGKYLSPKRCHHSIPAGACKGLKIRLSHLGSMVINPGLRAL